MCFPKYAIILNNRAHASDIIVPSSGNEIYLLALFNVDGLGPNRGALSALPLHPVVLVLMIVLLLAYYVAQSTLGDAGPIPLIEGRDLSSCSDQDSRRSILNIVWSCLTTIFLCTWVAVHPNIAFRPEKRNMGWFEEHIWDPLQEFLSYKLPLFLWALLVPEYILAWSIRQYINAGVIQKKGWTRTHGFFVLMGGFHLFQLPSDAPSVPLPLKPTSTSEPPVASNFLIPTGHRSHEDETPLYPLQVDDLPADILELITPSKKELNDKGKSDGLTKLIVLVQTAWFVIQCIARGAQQLPLTELEVVTLAYAMMNFFIYVFWWDKPRNVGCPIRVYKEPTASHEKEDVEQWEDGQIIGALERVWVYVLGYQDDYLSLAQATQIPMFWSGRLDDKLIVLASLGPSILGAAFGAIHCIAWSSEFSSHAELVLWRISSIAMIVVPLIATFGCTIGILMEKAGNPGSMRWQVLLGIFVASLILTAWLYIVARIATLLLAFIAMRSLPSAAFANVNWTSFIPHI